MSDTPETDAQLTTFTSISKLKKHFVNRTGTVSAEFARGLERERDEARRVADNLVEYAYECLAKLESWGKGYDRLEREMEDIREDIASCKKLKEAAK